MKTMHVERNVKVKIAICRHERVCLESTSDEEQVGKDQEKAQSEKDSHSQKRGVKNLN